MDRNSFVLKNICFVMVIVYAMVSQSLIPALAQDGTELFLPFFSMGNQKTNNAGQANQPTNSVDGGGNNEIGSQLAPIMDVSDDAEVIADRYIVVLKQSPAFSSYNRQLRNSLELESLEATLNAVISTHVTPNGGLATATYTSALTGFTAYLSTEALEELQRDPRIAYIEPDQVVAATTEQPNPEWGLDRIDQRDLPLDNSYMYEVDGTGVDVYVLDSGIRDTHQEFGGRVVGGYSVIDDGRGYAATCDGHGTHVAATVGGQTYGVAKGVSLYSVRVLDCDSGGTLSGVIQGIDWVTQNANGPSVANMSLGGRESQAEDDALRNSVAAGVFYAVAAGNSAFNACFSSPARVSEALTVGATTNTDRRATFSNYGPCVDIFAPGDNILSAWATDDSATFSTSGTSMATPMVAGAAALYLQSNPNASPAEVMAALRNKATPDKISNPGFGSANLLLYTLSYDPTPVATATATASPTPGLPTPIPTATPTPFPVDNETAVTVRVDSLSVATDGTSDVSIQILPGNSNETIGAISAKVLYDDTIVSVVGCEMMDYSGLCKTDVLGQVTLSGVNTNGQSSDSTAINITFQAIGAEGLVSSLELTVNSLANVAGINIYNYLTKDGNITIGDSILVGDVNCDQNVSVVDALLITQYVVELRDAREGCPLDDSTTQLYVAAGDVNTDGAVNVIDSLFIMQCQVEIANDFCLGD